MKKFLNWLDSEGWPQDVIGGILLFIIVSAAMILIMLGG